MNGVKSDVRGVLSKMIRWNTENASSTVIPSDTFSPLSGGSQNTVNEMMMQKMAGVRMFSR